MLTRSDIHAFLEEEGIARDATVLVHTSMRALGEVEGGCDGLIDGFVSYLRDGLFLVPTHTWANVNEPGAVFDVTKTPPCIGALPTVAAFRTDAVRSLHPTHSVAAFGRRAKEFVAGEENSQTPCPPGGVWARLLDEKATVLLLGVGLNRNTYIHAVDEMLDLPDRLVDPIPLAVLDGKGNRYEMLFRRHGNTGSENFGNFRLAFEACHALRYGKLGEATVGIFDTVKGTAALTYIWSRASYHLCEKEGDIPASLYEGFIYTE